uniref:selenoprotein P n=1 Tax=Myxine glutinosa TaxID=7769 RepID=UPI00358ECAF0
LEDLFFQISVAITIWVALFYARLTELHCSLAREGLPAPSLLLINSADTSSRRKLHHLHRAAKERATVCQTPANTTEQWHGSGGSHGDVYIYDRCHRLTFHMALPMSYLDFPYVKTAIMNTHSNEVCGPCPESGAETPAVQYFECSESEGAEDSGEEGIRHTEHQEESLLLKLIEKFRKRFLSGFAGSNGSLERSEMAERPAQAKPHHHHQHHHHHHPHVGLCKLKLN